MAPSTKVKKSTGDKDKKKKVARNRELGSGILRYSRCKQIKRKTLYRIKDIKKVKPDKPKVAITVVKKIGGAKNGEQRIVKLRKSKAHYPTKALIRQRRAKSLFKNHKRNTRKNLIPGKVLILIAGRHQGKRVVLLKVLASGLLLVNGPLKLNGCPIRRISQRYVICTRTKLNLKKVKIPEHINDTYFKRPTKKRSRRTEGEIFVKKEEKYVPTEQRKKDQAEVDKAIIAVIKKHPQRTLLRKYLKSMFALKTNQYPHQLRF